MVAARCDTIADGVPEYEVAIAASQDGTRKAVQRKASSRIASRRIVQLSESFVLAKNTNGHVAQSLYRELSPAVPAP